MSTIRVPLMGSQFVGQTGVPRHTQYHLCGVKQAVHLIREPDNPRDPNAVLATTETTNGDWIDLGYVPRNVAARISRELAAGRNYSSEISEIRDGDSDPTTKIVVVSITGPSDAHPAEEASRALSSAAEGFANDKIERPPASLPTAAPSKRIGALRPSRGEVQVERTTPSAPPAASSPVAGWLLFFCVTRGIIAPMVFYGLNDLSGNITLAQYVGILDSIANITIVVFLWMGRPFALTALKWYFLVAFGVIGLLLLGMAVTQESSRLAQEATGRLIFQGAYQAVWYIYFWKSERVSATYGRNM